MEWKHPPISKIYEALGAVADGRVVRDGDTARVRSSSGNKEYMVTYDPVTTAIMANDNGSYFQGYLGYPSIAYLMLVGAVPYTPHSAALLKGIAWKDLNTQFNNDFDAAIEHVLSAMSIKDRHEVEEDVARIYSALLEQRHPVLGEKVRPPEGY
ncbi:MAG TPA: hypothetical protein VHC20_03040 [Candidatus Paceibacterota bacterium]|nr:hypothetical protein [Candidatus Paceibacterota bacterium]